MNKVCDLPTIAIFLVEITEPPSHVREMIQNQIHMEPDQDCDDDDDDDSEEHVLDLDFDMGKKHKEKRKEKKTKFREAGTLDPMDPSSYSECPR